MRFPERSVARRILQQLTVLIVSLISPAALLAAPLSLADCYRIALDTRETLKQREGDIRAAEARYQQAVAEMYPQIGISGNQRLRDSPNFGSLSANTFNDPSTGLPRSRVLGRTQFEGLVTFTTPIFRGFRERALSRASEAEQTSLTHRLERDKQLLFLDISELYYQLLLFEDQQASIIKAEKTLKDRIKELNDFASLGKSRESEIYSADADLAQQALLKERTIRSSAATREVLASLLRLPPASLELKRDIALPVERNLDRMLDQVNHREDIKAAGAAEQMVRELITAEERSWWPSVFLDFNTYAVDDPNRHRDWEGIVRMSVPLFDGGRISARIAEQEAMLIRRRSESAEQRRIAEQEVRQSHAQLRHSIEAHKQAKLLYSARQKSYDAQRADYRNGQVTNIDVMNALTLLQRAELDVIDSRYTAANDSARLAVSAGEVPL